MYLLPVTPSVLVVLILLSANVSFGLYLYVRYSPRASIMVAAAGDDLSSYEGSWPPILLLNGFGKRVVFLTWLNIVITAYLIYTAPYYVD